MLGIVEERKEKAPIARGFLLVSVPLETSSASVAFARAGFVDDDCSPVHFLAIEHFDSFRGFLVRAHLDEAETARAPSHLVHDDGSGLNRSCLREFLSKILIRGFIREAADK